MCLDSCLKGREGKCCFNCSTRMGIHLIAILTLAEMAVVSWIFKSEMNHGLFNIKVFTWLFITVVRSFTYFAMCLDSISKRKAFMYTLMVTTLIELSMFVIMNFGLLDESKESIAFSAVASWGLGTAMQVLFVEALSLVHIVMFCYFCAIAYEYYAYARDDPAMIDAEHNRQATQEKKAALDRKKAKEAQQKQESELANQQDLESGEPLLSNDPNSHI